MSRKKASPQPTRRYFLLNKPVGVVSACRDIEHRTVLDCLPTELREGLFPVGRLDKNTEGLLLLTDDGKLNRWLLEPENHVEKRYILWAVGKLLPEHKQMLETGLQVKGISEPLKPVKVTILTEKTLREVDAPIFENRISMVEETPEAPAFCAELTLTEGKRHQIKRMMEAVGCTVVSLKRVSFGCIMLEDSLPVGSFRPLAEEEITSLMPQHLLR